MNADRPLRVAVVAHLRHPVAEPFKGGMEAHAHTLVHGLVERGHDVTLFASGDSDVRAPLVPVLPRHYDADLPWQTWRGTTRLTELLDRAYGNVAPLLTSGAFDVVHNNTLHPALPMLAQRSGTPMVTSLHVPPFPRLAEAVRGADASWHLVSGCSRAQLADYWPDGLSRNAVIVPNGIDLPGWPLRPVSGHRHAIWYGRISRTKAPHLAIDAARAAGLPLHMAGPVEDEAYFETEIRPRLSEDIRWVGALSGRALREFVGQGAVLLFTPDWDEPFGLVAIEAMASGVPVAALDRGGVRDVVGEGGVVVSSGSTEALARAALEAMELPRRVPRARVERLFSRDAMVAGYEALYARAIAERPMPVAQPA